MANRSKLDEIVKDIPGWIKLKILIEGYLILYVSKVTRFIEGK